MRDAKDSDKDAKTFFLARNDPTTRKFSRNSDSIEYDAHRKWYAASIHDPDKRLFVIECDGEPAGYCRVEGTRNEISIALLPEYRGRHVASGAMIALNRMLASETLLAVIRKDNEPSRILFERAGFRRTGAEGDWETWRRAPLLAK